MNAALTAREPSAKYLTTLQAPLVQHFDLLTCAPGGVARLRELILTLAVQGKLVPQDPADEPASELLKKIRAEKDRLMAEGKIKRDKPLAAIAEDEEPFELPSGWEWVQLAEIVQVLNGRAYGKQELLDTGTPILRVGNLFTSKHWYYSNLELEPAKYCEKGDLLYAWSASFGSFIWNGPKVIYHYHIWKLEPFSREAFNTSYFHTYLKEKTAEIKAAGHGVSMVHMTKEKMEKIIVPYPPLAEQSRIVTRVEELMRLCDALETKGQLEATQHAQLVSTLLGQLTASSTPDELNDHWQCVAQHFDLLLDRPAAVDALEQTLLQLAVRGLLVPQDPTDEPASELLKKIRAEKDRLIAEGKIKRDKPLPAIAEDEKPFELPAGWEWVRLGRVAKKITDGTHHSPANFPSGDFMYLSAKNIKPWGVDLSSATFVPKAVHDEIYARCDPEFGDILYIKDGATTGILAINTIREPFSLLSSVGVIKPSCGLTSDYMALVMQSPFFYQAMRDDMSGVAITRVTLSKLGNAKFPLPPLPEQSRIVARVVSLRRLCADLRQRLAERQTVQSQLAGALVASATPAA